MFGEVNWKLISPEMSSFSDAEIQLILTANEFASYRHKSHVTFYIHT
jgi:hypothetical protein